MNRARALLANSKPRLAARYGVTDLALFGSTARDTATRDVDVDVLVTFDGPATSERYFGVQFYLEDLLGRPIDLVTSKALRPELKPYIDSMSENTGQEWRFYLDDMIAFSEKVIAYSEGFEHKEFIANGITYDATLRNLELIGEAAQSSLTPH